MCFSAEASFAGAAVISAAGVATLSMVKDRREVPFAALPLLFGIHQFLEGITWLRLDGRGEAALTGVGVHSWVFFAWALLPIYVPWAVWLMESDPRRRRGIAVLMAIGGALAVFMAVQALQPEISVRVIDHNLDYVLALPFSAIWVAIPYVLATCIAPMLSTHRWVMAFGVANLLAMTAAAFIQSRDYSSIWCTFAAFLSLMIFGHFYTQRRRERAGTPAVA